MEIAITSLCLDFKTSSHLFIFPAVHPFTRVSLGGCCVALGEQLLWDVCRFAGGRPNPTFFCLGYALSTWDSAWERPRNV